MKDLIQNIFTFGGYKKIKEAQISYKAVYTRYFELHREYTENEKKVKHLFEELKTRKVAALLEVNKIIKISKSLSVKDRNVLERELRSQEYNIQKIEQSIAISEQFLNVGTGAFIGLSSGASIAGTAWALAGTYGIASTGTAISSLSGAAAANAGLAYLGGGSIASGGFGIIGGQIALGGIVAVPTLVITGLYQRWKANKKVIDIKDKEHELTRSIDSLRGNIEVLKTIDLRINEVLLALNKSLEIFHFAYQEAENVLYKYGILSKIWRWIKLKFKKTTFNIQELEKIKNLGIASGQVLKIVDSKIIHYEGKTSKIV